MVADLKTRLGGAASEASHAIAVHDYSGASNALSMFLATIDDFLRLREPFPNGQPTRAHESNIDCTPTRVDILATKAE
jgi:hypothetical protein